MSFSEDYKFKHDDAGKISDKLTKRICLGKVGEVFDLNGFVDPLIGCFKIDIRELVDDSHGWDDQISDAHREAWLNNFVMIQQLGELVYQRAVVPENAATMDV